MHLNPNYSKQVELLPQIKKKINTNTDARQQLRKNTANLVSEFEWQVYLVLKENSKFFKKYNFHNVLKSISQVRNATVGQEGIQKKQQLINAKVGHFLPIQVTLPAWQCNPTPTPIAEIAICLMVRFIRSIICTKTRVLAVSSPDFQGRDGLVK